MAIDVRAHPEALPIDETRPSGRRWLLVALSAAAGILIAIMWSADLVDDTIGGGIANPLVGGAEGAR